MSLKSNDTCLQKAADDEPIFVLRAQDKLAPAIVALWSILAQLHGAPDAKVVDAFDCAHAMEAWQRTHGGGKWPD